MGQNNKKNKFAIIGLATALVFTSVTAIVAPIILSQNNIQQQNDIKSKTIKEVKTNDKWKTFAQDFPTKTITAIQGEIDNAKGQWSSWVDAIDQNGKTNNQSFNGVKSITVTDKNPARGAQDYEFEFVIDWKQEYDIAGNVAASFVTKLDNIVSVSWEKAVIEIEKGIQGWINAATIPVTTTTEVEAIVNNGTNNQTLIGYLENNQHVETLSFSATKVNDNFDLTPTIVAKTGSFINNDVSVLTVSPKTISISVNYGPTAKEEIQKIIDGSTTPLLNASQIQTYLDNKKSEVQDLLTKNEHVETIALTVTEASANSFTLATTVTLKTGYTSSEAITDITGLTSKLVAKSVNWIDATTAKTAIQGWIVEANTSTPAELKTLLDTTKATEVKALFSDNTFVESITFEVSETAPFTITPSVNMNDGYTNSATLSNIADLDLQVSVDWINAANAKTTIQGWIDTAKTVGEANLKTLLDTTHVADVKALFSNSENIASVTFAVSGTGQYSVTPTITMNDGYANTATPVAIDGLNLWENVNVNWTDANAVKDAIQGYVDAGKMTTSEALLEAVNNTNNVALKAMLNNTEVATLTFTYVDNILTPAITMHDGFVQEGTVSTIEGLILWQSVAADWVNVTNATTAIQGWIDVAKTTNEVDLKTLLDTTNAAEVKALFSNSANIASVTFAVSGTEPYAVTPTITMNDGYVNTATPVAITGIILWTNVTVSWNEGDTPTDAIQTYIDTNKIVSSEALLTAVNHGGIIHASLLEMLNSDQVKTLSFTYNNGELIPSVEMNDKYINIGQFNPLSVTLWQEINLTYATDEAISDYIKAKFPTIQDADALTNAINAIDQTELINAVVASENKENVGTMTVGVSGAGPGVYNIKFNPIGGHGFVVVPASHNVLGVAIPAANEVAWSEVDVKQAIANNAAITTKAELDDWLVNPANADTIRAWFTGNENVATIAVAATGNGPFTLSATLTPTPGFATPTVPQITGVTITNDVQWGENSLNVVQGIINESTTPLISAVDVQTHLNGEGNKSRIEELLTPSANVASTTLTVVDGESGSFTLQAAVILNNGYVLKTNGSISLDGLNKKEVSVEVNWNDAAAAKTTIQGWINDAKTTNVAGLETLLDTTKATDVKALFSNTTEVASVTFDVSGTGPYTVTPTITMNDGYENTATPVAIDGLTLWQSISLGFESSQTLIEDEIKKTISNVTNLEVLNTQLDGLLNNQELTNIILTSNDENVTITDIQAVDGTTPGSYNITFTFSAKDGFIIGGLNIHTINNVSFANSVTDVTLVTKDATIVETGIEERISVIAGLNELKAEFDKITANNSENTVINFLLEGASPTGIASLEWNIVQGEEATLYDVTFTFTAASGYNITNPEFKITLNIPAPEAGVSLEWNSPSTISQDIKTLLGHNGAGINTKSIIDIMEWIKDSANQAKIIELVNAKGQTLDSVEFEIIPAENFDPTSPSYSLNVTFDGAGVEITNQPGAITIDEFQFTVDVVKMTTLGLEFAAENAARIAIVETLEFFGLDASDLNTVIKIWNMVPNSTKNTIINPLLEKAGADFVTIDFNWIRNADLGTYELTFNFSQLDGFTMIGGDSFTLDGIVIN